MRVFRGYSRPDPVPTVLTLGNFDGVHLGHLALLERAREAARQLGLPLSVLTFEPHPREFFAPDSAPARLTTLREKLERFRDFGVDQTFVCAFNARFAALDAESFIRRVLVDGVGVRHLLVGDDFRFGAGRQGDFELLQTRGRDLGFAVETMGSRVVGDERVSSSGVREALAAGDMERAAALLGRSYAIDGRVVHGRKLGRQLGFATANIYIRHNPLPMTGVFAVRVLGPSGVVRQGVANLGIRPTVGGTRPLLEVHVFDFQGDIYGAHLSAEFVHKLRDEMKFSDLSVLQAQIAADAATARAYFRAE